MGVFTIIDVDYGRIFGPFPNQGMDPTYVIGMLTQDRKHEGPRIEVRDNPFNLGWGVAMVFWGETSANFMENKFLSTHGRKNILKALNVLKSIVYVEEKKFAKTVLTGKSLSGQTNYNRLPDRMSGIDIGVFKNP